MIYLSKDVDSASEQKKFIPNAAIQSHSFNDGVLPMKIKFSNMAAATQDDGQSNDTGGSGDQKFEQLNKKRSE